MNVTQKGKNYMLSIAVIGPGAVGTTIAYELQQQLPQTKLIGKTATTLSYYPTPNSDMQSVGVSSYEEINEKFDVIIIAVKTHQLDAVIKQIDAFTHSNTMIILAQNGYGQLEKLPYTHIYQAVVYISGQKSDQTIIAITVCIYKMIVGHVNLLKRFSLVDWKLY